MLIFICYHVNKIFICYHVNKIVKLSFVNKLQNFEEIFDKLQNFEKNCNDRFFLLQKLAKIFFLLLTIGAIKDLKKFLIIKIKLKLKKIFGLTLCRGKVMCSQTHCHPLTGSQWHLFVFSHKSLQNFNEARHPEVHIKWHATSSHGSLKNPT